MLDRSRSFSTSPVRPVRGAARSSARRAATLAGAFLVATAAPLLAGEPDVDAVASFTGPFGGATGMKEMAQSFQVSKTGFLHRIEAWIPTTSGDPCEVVWYLRDGATLDPENPDISGLPVLASGTGMSSEEPDFLYDAVPSVLLAGANLPIVDGDVLVLHLVRPCNFAWLAGVGTLPGDRFESDGVSEWMPAEVGSLEYGRMIVVSDEESPVGSTTWSGIKATHR